jgi:hypothetical protein
MNRNDDDDARYPTTSIYTGNDDGQKQGNGVYWMPLFDRQEVWTSYAPIRRRGLARNS